MTVMKPLICFAHATGFPGGSYQRLFHFLAPHFDVIHVPMLGHDPKYPVDSNWGSLVKELLAFLDAHADRPVIAVGHSLGAVVSFMAAWQAPEKFKALVMLDPPVISGPGALVFGLAKWLGYADKLTPAGRTLGRREVWPDIDSARAYFRSRPLFAHFDPQCLEDYLLHGLKPDAQGVRLSFDPSVEIEMFRNTPHNSWRYRRSLQIPAALITCEKSRVIRPDAIARLVRLHGMRHSRVAGGHMFPLEHPEATAMAIREALVDLHCGVHS